MSAEFETIIGSPQGDSLSQVLFTCCQADLLSDQYESIQPDQTRPASYFKHRPMEMEYADDTEFLDEERFPWTCCSR